MPGSPTPFEALTWAITGQQITVAVAVSLRRKLIAHGAKFVIGIFLAKTIVFEDERNDLSINDYTIPTTSK